MRPILLAGLMLCLFSVASAEDHGPPTLQRDVLPIFREKCGKCHSERVRKGGLSLADATAIRKGGESGEPLVAASLDDSALWSMVDGGGMPPEDEPQLDATQLQTIKQWLTDSNEVKQWAVEEHALTQHDVLPIVLLRCVTCHGPQRTDGGLDMRTRAAMLKGGKHGPALIPGDADGSPMIQRIVSEACPPRDLLLKFFVRRPPTAELETLRKWIDAGAPEDDSEPDVATTEPDPLVTDEQREYWAFQPPAATKPPAGEPHPIDAFIAARLKAAGLQLAPEADRATLIRRAYIDLIGMPPTLPELRQWLNSKDPRWHDAMVDHLLASPHYGERWGRYWLDLAGYADSEGGISADPVRPVAWKYRDYVVRAFNEDKPYDRFLLEQLAGDELIDYDRAEKITPEMVDNLVATGFLRMGIDETGSRTMNFVPERLKVISDAITIVGAGLMGLTMECARCHSHKYDPIPHRDYYRFKAVFQGALDEHDWRSFKTRTLKVATTDHRRQVAAVNPPLQTKLKQLEGQRRKLEGEIQLELLRGHYPEQSEQDNRATIAALKVADNNRTLPQRRLVERLFQAELLPDSRQPESVLALRAQSETLQHEIERTEREMAPALEIRALWDSGRPSPTYALLRGEHDRPGALVGPGVPSVLTDGKTPFVATPPFPEGTPKTGRRLALAKWMTRPDHPLTSRVFVNRVWRHHFGVGLKHELDNFGMKSDPPTHPQLLDWLAVEFVRRGWSIKELHRLIMSSKTYRQSSHVSEQAMQLDPQNLLWSRMPLQRLDAESLRDSLLRVSGRLDDTPGGLPDPVTVGREGLVTANETAHGGWRRSIYLQYRRTEIPTMMETFDYPKMGPNCVSRVVSTVSPQALMMMNNGRVRELSAALAARVVVEAADAGTPDSSEPPLRQWVELVSLLALSRPASPQELDLGVEALKKLARQWEQDSAEPAAANLRALETYCHTILNSAAFAYVD
ncbi:MAG: DUF1553 domain-containing protein [Planctomycetales bacterium]|nr:DUF1553 domain-containing protein [Planctomycetales bacterium]